MKKKKRRIVSWLLMLAMIFTALPTAAFAEDAGGDDGSITLGEALYIDPDDPTQGFTFPNLKVELKGNASAVTVAVPEGATITPVQKEIDSTIKIGDLNNRTLVLLTSGDDAKVDATVIENYLKGMKFQNCEDGAEITIRVDTNKNKGFSDIPANTKITYNSSNGHYYMYANTGDSGHWHTAVNYAHNYTLGGRRGYLATPTSMEELRYLNEITANENLWVGATVIRKDADTKFNLNLKDENGEYGTMEDSANWWVPEATNTGGGEETAALYYWVDGPEAGQDLSVPYRLGMFQANNPDLVRGWRVNHGVYGKETCVQYSTSFNLFNDIYEENVYDGDRPQGACVEFGGYEDGKDPGGRSEDNEIVVKENAYPIWSADKCTYAIADQTYTGTALTPDVTITYTYGEEGDEKTITRTISAADMEGLSEAERYYSANNNIYGGTDGKGTVTLKGSGAKVQVGTYRSEGTVEMMGDKVVSFNILEPLTFDGNNTNVTGLAEAKTVQIGQTKATDMATATVPQCAGYQFLGYYYFDDSDDTYFTAGALDPLKATDENGNPLGVQVYDEAGNLNKDCGFFKEAADATKALTWYGVTEKGSVVTKLYAMWKSVDTGTVAFLSGDAGTITGSNVFYGYLTHSLSGFMDGENAMLSDTFPTVTVTDETKNKFLDRWLCSADQRTYTKEQILAYTFPEGQSRVTFTAQYKDLSKKKHNSTAVYTLRFETNGGSSIDSIQKDAGTVVDLDAYVPKKDGYRFDGWYSSEKLSRKIQNITLDDDRIVYAKWSEAAEENKDETEDEAEDKTKGETTDQTADVFNVTDHHAYVFGYTDGKVYPDETITRAQTAAMLYRLLTAEVREEIFATTNSFTDVAAESWYNEAVSGMANGGYIYGYPDGNFGPNNAITRAEFAAMIVRMTGAETVFGNSFADVADDYWAKDVINTATEHGWVKGIGDGYFAPERELTRAEAMAIINRVLNRGVDANGLTADAKQWADNAVDAWYYYDVLEATNGHLYTGSRPSEIWTSLQNDAE